MDVTELAHWRYRVKALEVDLRKTLLDGHLPYPELSWGEDEGSESYQKRVDTWNKVTEAKHKKYYLEYWLLEEAKYKSELGELELRLSESHV